jgi:hypothetical protein
MRHHRIALVLPVLMAAVLALTGMAPPERAFAEDRAMGHGRFTTGGAAVTRFVFNVRVKSGGTVDGRARFFDGASLNLDLDVTCITFVNSTTVIIGGTDHDNPSTTYAFRAIDNGSSGSPADQITLPQSGQTCATFNTLGNWSVAGSGDDIEVRDV